MAEKRIQTGLRIPESNYKELLEISKKSGVSINSLVLQYINIGLEITKSRIEKYDRNSMF